MKKRISKRQVAFSLAILFLMIVMLFSGLQILESTIFNQEPEEPTTQSKTILRDGKSYFPRQDITTIMLLGIDEEGPVRDSGSYNNPGVSDVISLLVLDHAAGEARILNLNRDTMVDMPVLGLGGKPAGTQHAQLGLAHTYGSGLEDSCENTKATVSNLLHGIRIDYYLSLHMDAVAILNDLVGGVTVTVEDDFTSVDPTLPTGQVTLKGDQALTFVRTRMNLGDQLNVTRMNRQNAYMQGFLTAFRSAIQSNENFLLSAYEEVSPYLVTDCSTTTLTNLVSQYEDYTLVETVTPVGENQVVDSYYQFHLDPIAMDDLTLRLFYAEKD